MAIWYCLWSFVIIFPIWNVWTKKNLATLLRRRKDTRVAYPKKTNIKEKSYDGYLFFAQVAVHVDVEHLAEVVHGQLGVGHVHAVHRDPEAGFLN
jgi:hypothetical protein